MDVAHTQALLEGMEDFQKPTRESTIFGIGARGYFENPTTDLLAFFCYPKGEHGLGDAVLVALLDCLPPQHQPSPGEKYLTCRPEREWVTSLEQRIDLVLKSDNWVLAIENKIYHGLQNDFIHYADDLSMRLAGPDNRKMLYTVLSPDGCAPNAPGWLGISYTDLLCRLRKTIGTLYEQYGDSKWLIFLREFALHLENLTMTETLTDGQEHYVLEHLGEINSLIHIKNQALGRARGYLLSILENSLDSHSIQIVSWQDNWRDGPAMRFQPKDWKSQSVLTVHLPFEESGSVYLICYIDKKSGDFNSLPDYGFAVKDFDTTDVETTTRYFTKGYQKLDWDNIASDLCRYMNALINLEVDGQLHHQEQK